MRQYPNPDLVPYATTMPATYPCQLTTQDPGKNIPIHYHSAYIDKDGNGNTDVDSGHFHRVKDFKVQVDPSDGHTHGLTTLPCGPSAPVPTARYGPLVQMAGAGGGGWSWPWVVGAIVVIGLAVGVVVYAGAHGADE